jgi:EAL domain-containing protein (putative c-di-GMP-specific phosphodiesterase class I)
LRVKYGIIVAHSRLAKMSIQELDITMQSHLELERRELELHYQAIVDSDRHIVGVETFLRLASDGGRLGFPSDLVSAARGDGTITAITVPSILTAWEQLRNWRTSGISASINLYEEQISLSLVSEMNALIAGERIDPAHFVLEIHEEVPIKDDIVLVIQQLHGLGFQIALDDVGTKMRTISVVEQGLRNGMMGFIDMIKLDRDLIAGLSGTPSVLESIEEIVEIAHQRGKLVVAEGVLERATFDSLVKAGVDYFQGYGISHLIAPPLDIKDLLVSRF